MNLIRKAIITGLGSGYLPAPGTWGSLIPCIIFLALAYITDAGSHEFVDGGLIIVNAAMLILCIASSAACVSLGKFAEETFGKKDPQQVNIDEIAGQSLALLATLVADEPSYMRLVAAGVAFVAFRFFDILKPPPARRMEKLPHGWGILMDDLVAGVYAAIVTQLVLPALHFWII